MTDVFICDADGLPLGKIVVDGVPSLAGRVVEALREAGLRAMTFEDCCRLILNNGVTETLNPSTRTDHDSRIER